MARIKGVDIPDNKRVEISLTYIYGIGRSLGSKIVEIAGLDKNKRVKDLTEAELNKIRDIIKELESNEDGDQKVILEGDLRREVNKNIKEKMEIGCYEGLRWRKKLPVRGQRTSRNAKNAKRLKGKKVGVTIANKKK